MIGVALDEHPPLDQPSCRLDWFDQQAGLPCSISITAYFYPISELGAAGLADIPNRVIYVGSELTGLELGGTVAHEVGHCIFDSGDHLPPGESGIMSVYASPTVIPTKADLRYAALHTHGWY